MSTALEPMNLKQGLALKIEETKGFVTMRVDHQLIGVSVLLVQDVLREMNIAKVPLSPPEIAGLMNLRGRIVTVVDVRKRLGFGDFPSDKRPMHAVVEYKNELFSLMVDSVGDVMNLPVKGIEKAPANLESRWREVAAGVNRLEKELLVILDIQALLTF